MRANWRPLTVLVVVTVGGCHWLYPFSQTADDDTVQTGERPGPADGTGEPVPRPEASADLLVLDGPGQSDGCGSCDDGITCTTDSCTQQGWCMHLIEPGFCLIDKACIPHGTNNPKNILCESCDAAESSTAWTPDDSVPCDDGVPCTYGDKCNAGACKGTTYSCTADAAALACVQDSCTGEGPPPWGCALVPDHCLIDKLCYAKGATIVGDPCRLCQPALSAYSWSPAKACVSTLAGSGKNTVTDHFGELAAFSDPWGLALDSSFTPATLYVAEYTGHVVRQIEGGQVEILAGCS